MNSQHINAMKSRTTTTMTTATKYYDVHTIQQQGRRNKLRRQRSSTTVIKLNTSSGSLVFETPDLAASAFSDLRAFFSYATNNIATTRIHRWMDDFATTLHYHFTSTDDGADKNFVQNAMFYNNKHTTKEGTKQQLFRPLFCLYAASCFMYTAAGLAMHRALCDNWCTVWPWQIEGWLFVLQGVVSYMSDVHTLGYKSYWHCVDRCFATTLFGLIVTRIIMVTCNIQNSSTNQGYFVDSSNSGTITYFFWIFCLGLFLSTICFVMSGKLTRQNKPREMMLAHIGWHLFAPSSAIILYLSV